MSQNPRVEYEISADMTEDVDGDKTAVPSVQEDTEAQNKERPVEADTLDESRLLTGKRLVFAFIGLMLATFLMAADATILAPALGVISSQFNASTQIGWIVSAYFLAEASCVLTYGQILQLFDRKWVFLIAIGLFELGSLLCGVAPSIEVLIFGRAIKGCGGAGIMVSNISIIAQCTRLQDRPKLFGLFGAVFGVSSVIGPLLGGVFTEHVTWRLCFLINLPIGLIAILAIIFLIPRAPYKPVDPAMRAHAEQRAHMFFRIKSLKKELLVKFFCLDYFGTFSVLAFVIMLTMALQWGGVEHPWSSATIIGLLVAAVAMLAIFIAWMIYTRDSFPLFSIDLLRNRSVAGACVFAFGCSFVLQAGANYIPLYWQVTRQRTATESGLDLLPFVLGITGCAVTSGFIVSKTGSYAPWILLSPALTAVGSGLLYRSDAYTPASQIKGFTFLMAAGIGFIFQQSSIIVQANVTQSLIPSATALTSLFQLFGGLVGSSICSAIFQGQLIQNLKRYAPSIEAHVLQTRVSAVYDETVVPLTLRPSVIEAYTKALNLVLFMGVPVAGVIFLAACVVKKVNLKGAKKPPQQVKNESVEDVHQESATKSQ